VPLLELQPLAQVVAGQRLSLEATVPAVRIARGLVDLVA
jgi:hypothetical protein